jgi:Flp pilus assembly protein TadG
VAYAVNPVSSQRQDDVFGFASFPLKRLRCRFVHQRGFHRRKDGATAVEFALIAIPFLMVLFAVLETALSFWSQQVLETAVSDAARQVYTGRFQKDIQAAGALAGAPLSAAEVATRFQTLVCSRVTAVFACSRVKFDIRSISDFNSVSLTLPVNSSRQFDTASWQVTQPVPNSIVVVRAAMEYPVIFPLLKLGNGALASGNKLVMASAAFMTEPY